MPKASSTPKRTISWSDTFSDSGFETKKRLPTTPYPQPLKKRKITNVNSKSKLKQKLEWKVTPITSKTKASKGNNTAWKEENLLLESYFDNSNFEIKEKNAKEESMIFDPDNKLAEKIFKNLKNAKLIETISKHALNESDNNTKEKQSVDSSSKHSKSKNNVKTNNTIKIVRDSQKNISNNSGFNKSLELPRKQNCSSPKSTVSNKSEECSESNDESIDSNASTFGSISSEDSNICNKFSLCNKSLKSEKNSKLNTVTLVNGFKNNSNIKGTSESDEESVDSNASIFGSDSIDFNDSLFSLAQNGISNNSKPRDITNDSFRSTLFIQGNVLKAGKTSKLNEESIDLNASTIGSDSDSSLSVVSYLDNDDSNKKEEGNKSKWQTLSCTEIDATSVKFSSGNPFETCSFKLRDEFATSTSSDIFSTIKTAILDTNNCEIIKPNIKRQQSKGDEIENLTKKQYLSKMNLTESTCESSEFNEVLEKVEQNIKEPIINLEKFVNFQIVNNTCLLVLKHSLKLYFYGKLSIKILSGLAEIIGYKLDKENEAVEVYSPRGNCCLCIETLQSNDTLDYSKEVLSNYKLTKVQMNSLLNGWTKNSCLLIVKNIANEHVSYVSRHVAQHLYPSYSSEVGTGIDKLEKYLRCVFNVEASEWKGYKASDRWVSFVNDMLLDLKNGESRTVICGGKGVGKSTTLRYMVNCMLNCGTNVACIDLDLGQSEFTIGGCVSVTIVDSPLLGPNYTHLRKPIKSFYVGETNIMQSLNRYMSSVEALLLYCEKNLDNSIPWIINYPGFTQSIGTDLAVSVIKLFRPTLVIQIQSKNNKYNYISKLDVDFVQNYKSTLFVNIPNGELNYKCHSLNSVAEDKVSGNWECQPRQVREMSILSYFSEILKGKSEITDVQPYVVSLSSLKLQHVNYTKKNIKAVLNGNLVALSHIPGNQNKNSLIPGLGFGIIRGIDVENDKLYLLTPVSEKELQTVNCLTMGSITLPPSLYMTPGCEGLVPYVSLGVPKRTSLAPKRAFRPLKALIKKNNG